MHAVDRHSVPVPPRRRRFTAPCSATDTNDARLVAQVPHIHDLTGQAPNGGAMRGGARGVLPSISTHALPPPSSAPRNDPWRRLSAAPRRHSTEPVPSWERSLRSRPLLPTITDSRSQSRKRNSAKTVETVPAGVAAEDSKSDSWGQSLTDSDESERTTRASAPDSRKPSSDFFIQYNRVSLRAQDEAATLRAATRTREAYTTLTRLFVPVWRLHRYRLKQRLLQAAAKADADEANSRTALMRREATNLIGSVLQHRLTTLLPYAVNQWRCAAVRIQRCYRAHDRTLQAIVELNFRRIRQEEERRYWQRVVVEREDALQREADARAAALLTSAPAPGGDVTASRGGRKASSQPGMPLELDVYNYFLVGPLPERLVRQELRRAVVAVFHQRRRSTQRPFWESRRAAAIQGKSARALPSFLPRETLTAVLDNVCFLASQFRNDPMLRSHLRGRPMRILPYS